MLDQRNLPTKYEFVEYTTVEQVAESILQMVVRGAPAIGAAGGFGMAIAAFKSTASTSKELLADLASAKKILDAARPTAVNLEWATGRILEMAQMLDSNNYTADAIRTLVHKEAQELADDDVRINTALGNFGAAVVPDKANILHHW
jgi:methylthioribose-1-phosphate isomerase